jgi:hypothetical protein
MIQAVFMFTHEHLRILYELLIINILHFIYY